MASGFTDVKSCPSCKGRCSVRGPHYKCDVCGVEYCSNCANRSLADTRVSKHGVGKVCAMCIKNNNLKVVDPEHPLFIQEDLPIINATTATEQLHGVQPKRKQP